MADILTELFEVVAQRKLNPQEGSYTCYLFDKGIDKILKKVGEEASEVIISAKNGNNDDTVNEISDLLYHLVVLMAEQGISPEQLNAVLEERRKKIGNLKTFNIADKNT
jgi:phosphoribosyl-ATP pyrophosphohydrolase